MRAVTAADANRHFSSMLRAVGQGEELIVLSRGKPVATLSPIRGRSARKHIAKEVLLARLQSQAMTGARNWVRDELYD